MPVIVPFGGVTPLIAPSAWVAPNATLIGTVSIDAGSSIFYGAVIRGDRDSIRIGASTNIQDNVTMHTDAGVQLVVGSRVSVGHGAILHGCSIGDDCLIGMGSTIMNGAVVGAGSLVAAGSLVLEYTSIPEGSLVVGSPAKVVRALTSAERADLTENARSYSELAVGHRAATS